MIKAVYVTTTIMVAADVVTVTVIALMVYFMVSKFKENNNCKQLRHRE